jgi:hypothetical protein
MRPKDGKGILDQYQLNFENSAGLFRPSTLPSSIDLINNIPCDQINEVESFYEKKESEFFNEVFDKDFYAKDVDEDDEDLQEIDEKYKNYQSKYCGEKRDIISESEDNTFFMRHSSESS